jgi:dihydroorotase
LVEDGIIKEVIPFEQGEKEKRRAKVVYNGQGLILAPAFIDMHAHFRDPGRPEKETLESACLAAVAGGYGTAVCMANTTPPLDTETAVSALKIRSDALGLIDLYPALSLTKGMEGRELSEIKKIRRGESAIRLFSEDGKDVSDDALFLDALKRAAELGIPVSCHCDCGGKEAEGAKQSGKSREIWSRIEENRATDRAIRLGKEAGCRLHIAHVSTKEAVSMVREAKKQFSTLTCEATPHHIGLTEETADMLGKESFGRVNPPLRTEEDRLAVIEGIRDGTIDAIATDHAPHSEADKARGAPGFSGLETAFAVCYTELVRKNAIDLRKLIDLMSASPSRVLGFSDRGRIRSGMRADLIVIDADAEWVVNPAFFKSRGKNSAFAGKKLYGKVRRLVFEFL